MRNTLLTYIDRFRRDRRERLALGSVLLFLAVMVSLFVYWQLRYTGITMSNETFCGYEEHVHTEECYDEEGNLVCELEEHSHTVDCLINLNADVEDAVVWKATLPELTVDLRTDVVNIAYSQLGYAESTANFSPREDGVTRYGYTRYGAWYGNEYGTWDAMFVSFCLNYAGVDRTAFPLNSGAYSWAVELSEIGSYAEASAYTPLAGDIVFFDTDLDGRIDRVGIVASTDISGGVVTIIEGDYTVSEVDTVCEHIYALNDPTISGYGIIADSEEVEEETEAEETAEEIEETEESEEIEIEETEDTEEDEETEIEETEETEIIEVIEEAEEETEEIESVEESEESSWVTAEETVTEEVVDETTAETDEEVFINTLVYCGSDYIITVTYGEDALLPEDVTLLAYEYSKDSETYIARYAEAAELYGWEEDYTDKIRLFNVGFYDEFGNEIEPAAEVQITITYFDQSAESDSYTVAHFGETETETIETDTTYTDGVQTITFGMDSFSDIMVIDESEDEDDENGIMLTATATTTTLEQVTITSDVISNLAGSTYIIANSTGAYALSSETASNANPNGLTAESISVDSTQWTFISAGNGCYYIQSSDGSYLKMSYYSNDSGSLSVVNNQNQATAFNVTTVTSNGTTYLLIYANNIEYRKNNYTYYINQYGGTSSTKFAGYTQADTGCYLQLYTVTTTTISDGVYITDNIAASGELVASLVAGGVTVDLSDTSCGYTVVWYKSESELSSDLSTCTNLEKYEIVDDSGVLFKNGSAVNVALDDGGLCYYKAVVYDSNSNYIGEAVMWVPYADEIMNSSFEYTVTSGDSVQTDYSNVPFWSTTASGGLIEIGKYSASSTTYGTNTSTSGGSDTGIYAGGSQAGAGNQFAELNAKNVGSLYQDVLTIPGENLYWSLYHRARTAAGGGYTYDATDTMYVVIMSEEDAQLLLEYAGSNQQSALTTVIDKMTVTSTSNDTNATQYKTGTYTFTLNGESVTVTLTVWELETETSADGEWTYYYGNYTVPEGQYLSRFFFVSGDTYYSEKYNDYSVGNLIDNANFSQEISYVIEYWLWDSTKNTWVLDTTYTESGTVENGTNVYASNLSKYPGYGLCGSVTGTSSGGSSPTFDANTTTAMRVKGGTTTYLSLYLYTPVVTVVKEIGGLSESEIDAMLDDGTYTVTFTITPVSGGDSTTVTLTVGETGIASNYTTALTAGEEYTITETVNYTGSFLKDYDCTVTVSGATTSTNGLETTYTFTPTDASSLTITFTNTYAEVVTGGPEMPQTGGRGTKLYTMVGLLLICSGGYLLYRTLKQHKRKCNRRWNI